MAEPCHPFIFILRRLQSFPVASSLSGELLCRGSRRLFALPSPSFRWSVRGESGALPFQNQWHHLNGADNWSLVCKTIILGYVYGRLDCSVKGTKWGWASSEMSLRTHGSTDFSVGYPYGWEAKLRAVTLKQCVVPMCFLIFFFPFTAAWGMSTLQCHLWCGCKLV